MTLNKEARRADETNMEVLQPLASEGHPSALERTEQGSEKETSLKAEEERSAFSLFEAFELDYGDEVALIGAGGKTHLMYALAREAARRFFRVLITTSTHIAKPTEKEIRSFSDFTDLRQTLRLDPSSAIYAYGKEEISRDGTAVKYAAADPEELELLRADFDLFLVEADGAKCRPLKGWRSFEPVIPPHATKTVMVLPADLWEKEPDEEQIFHPELFREQFMPGETTDSECYLNILDTTQGPLSKAEHSRLYVYLSRSDLLKREELQRLREELAAGIRRRGYRAIKIIDTDGRSLLTEEEENGAGSHACSE